MKENYTTIKLLVKKRNELKITVLVAICLIPLFTIPIFASSEPEPEPEPVPEPEMTEEVRGLLFKADAYRYF